MFQNLKGVLAASLVCPLIFAATFIATVVLPEPLGRWAFIVGIASMIVGALVFCLSHNERPWRFSLLSLLIATTLIALLLGIIAAAT